MAKTGNDIIWYVMGKEVGTATGWDQQDDLVIIIYDLTPNELGRRFIPTFPDCADLVIDFERGEVTTYDEVGIETLHKADWSVFNK